MNRIEAQPELPHVSVVVGPDQRMSVALNGKTQELPTEFAGDPWQPARDLAAAVGMAVFAEVTQDGVTYGEVVEPAIADAPAAPPTDPVARLRPGSPFTISGDGFKPGEDVYVAVVVSTRRARPDGVAQLPLPGALLNRLPGVVIMFGLDSQTLIVADPASAATSQEHAA